MQSGRKIQPELSENHPNQIVCERILGRMIQPELSENHPNQIVFFLNHCLAPKLVEHSQKEKKKVCLDRLESYGVFSFCQACEVAAISFRMGSSEAFLVLACRSTTLLQGSSMAGTTLTVYVGLTPSDAQKIFMEHQAVQPHWKGRWGLNFLCHVML